MDELPKPLLSSLPKFPKSEGGNFFFHIGLYPPESNIVSKVIAGF
jgi:hypothetical protein